LWCRVKNGQPNSGIDGPPVLAKRNLQFRFTDFKPNLAKRNLAPLSSLRSVVIPLHAFPTLLHPCFSLYLFELPGQVISDFLLPVTKKTTWLSGICNSASLFSNLIWLSRI
jgi:hypothetical protein